MRSAATALTLCYVIASRWLDTRALWKRRSKGVASSEAESVCFSAQFIWQLEDYPTLSRIEIPRHGLASDKRFFNFQGRAARVGRHAPGWRQYIDLRGVVENLVLGYFFGFSCQSQGVVVRKDSALRTD